MSRKNLQTIFTEIPNSCRLLLDRIKVWVRERVASHKYAPPVAFELLESAESLLTSGFQQQLRLTGCELSRSLERFSTTSGFD